MATEKTAEKLGRYEIIAELGHGAMGIVYKAIDPLIDRTVAIKTIKLDLSRDELANFEERFYREAKSAGRLNHPNIVTIHDVGKTDNVAYMAMEFLEGRALREVLDVHTALSIDKIVDIAAQIADGLAYAHENGIVHRDIKPANIMLVRDGIAKITDFGIAQTPTGSRTLAGTILGSPKYMAPEQVLGKAVDGRSDLFSLGVVLYEMLTGESPFNGDNINTTMYRILNETPVPPKTLTPRIPDVFDAIVAKLLAKHPDERYQNARELAIDLRNYKNLPISNPASVAFDQSAPQNLKAKPRNNIGAETVFLSPTTGDPVGGNTVSGETETIQMQPAAIHTRRGAFWQNKKILIPSILVLLLVFTGIVLLDKPAQKTPPQIVIASAPARTNPPSEGDMQPIPASPDSTLLKVEPSAAAPQIPVMPRNTKPVIASSTPSREQEISSRETQTAPPDSAKSRGNAVLSFAITPWGDVYVDGKKAGASPPLRQLTVPAGKHTIEIRNLDFAPYAQAMDLQADTTKNIKYIFKQR